MKAFVRHVDTTVIDAIGSWPPALQPLFLVITTIGHPAVAIMIGACIVANGLMTAHDRLVLAGFSVWATLALGSFLKLLFGRARPVTDYAASIRLDTLSFPSGHTTGSTVAYGLLAYIAWYSLPQPWNYIATVACVALIGLIGLSRVYLGAHFPSDVVAGWLLGGAALIVIIVIIKPLA